MSTQEARESRGINRKAFSLLVLAALLLFGLHVLAMKILPYQESASVWQWPEHDINTLAVVGWGDPWNQKTYAASVGGHRTVGTPMGFWARFKAPFVLEIDSEFYTFQYRTEWVLKLIYKRHSLWERFGISYAEVRPRPEILPVITEGERRIDEKREALEEECARYRGVISWKN